MPSILNSTISTLLVEHYLSINSSINASIDLTDFSTNPSDELLDEVSNEVVEYCFNATTLEAVPSPTGRLFLIILYTCTSILALVGNVTVIIVELYGNESAPNIRKYLINLAVSDIIISVVCVPFTYTDFMLGQWIFPHWLCPAAQYVQLLSVFVTSITLTIIGVERYMALVHPFTVSHHWLSSHTPLILGLVWAAGACYAYIPYENTFTRPFVLNEAIYYECSYDNDISELKRRLFMTSNFVFTFALPFGVLVFSYSAMMRKVLNETSSSNGNDIGETVTTRTKTRTSTRQHHGTGSQIPKRNSSCASTSPSPSRVSFSVISLKRNSDTLNINGDSNGKSVQPIKTTTSTQSRQIVYY